MSSCSSGDVVQGCFTVGIIDIYLRASEDLSEIHITYQLPSNAVRSKGIHEYQLNRAFDESVVKTMHRLVINCKSKLTTVSNKAKKGSKASASSACTKNNTDTQLSALPSTCKIKYNCNDVSNVDLLKVSELQSDMLIYVESFCFRVIRNHPTITLLSTFPKKVLFCGGLVVPQVSLESANDFQCTWLCEDSPRSNVYATVSTEKTFTPMLQHVGCRLKLMCCAVDSSSSCGGTPRIGRPIVSYLSGCIQLAQIFNKMLDIRSDYHHLPRGSCQPSSSSSSITLRSSAEIRVMSYNILAEPYATSHQAIHSLFRYCDKSYLDSEYRLQRSLVEVLACDADVVCLQECDLKTYESYWLPALGSRGYAGHYSDKSGREGCATFVLSKSYEVVRTFDVSLKHVLRTAPYLSFLFDLRPDLRDVIGGKLGTVCQLTLMRSVTMPYREVIVCNTHLFYHPFAGMIRLFQLFAITRMVEELLKDLSADDVDYSKLSVAGADEVNEEYVKKERRLRSMLSSEGSPSIAPISQHAAPMQRGVVIAGDLNSTLSTAAIEFLTTGRVSLALWTDEWSKLQDFRWGSQQANSDEDVHELQMAVAAVHVGEHCNSVSHRTGDGDRTTCGGDGDMALIDKSSDGSDGLNWSGDDVASMRSKVIHQLDLVNVSGLPEYTNYTADFKDTLDYILVSRHCYDTAAVRVAPFPSVSILSEYVALPSAVFPSDHLSVAVDVRWKS